MDAALSLPVAQARRNMVAYVAPLIHEGIPRGDTQSLGQILWAAAHGLVMPRLSGIVSSDTELRQLQETTMSTPVPGAHQMKAGNYGTGAREPEPHPKGGAKDPVNSY